MSVIFHFILNSLLVTFFADHCAVYTSDYNSINLQSALQIEVNNLVKWSSINGMFINTNKAKSILITRRQKLLNSTTTSLQLSAETSEIENVYEHKTVVLTTDQYLT